MTTDLPAAPSPVASTAPAPELLAAARALVTPGRRRVLGITGAPGAGKSTLAEQLVAALGPDAVLVGMDGFHLDDPVLHALGRHSRKGAPDTFDTAGYVALLRRLRTQGADEIVYAPRFDRSLEASIGSAVPVAPDVPLVVTEGNYLLLDDPAWSPVAGLLDECWFVDPGEQVRLDRLVTRHMSFGRPADEALERATSGSDGRNAELVTRTRVRADRVVGAHGFLSV